MDKYEARRSLQDMHRELFLLQGSLEEVQKRLDEICKRRSEIAKEIVNTLNGGTQCDT